MIWYLKSKLNLNLSWAKGFRNLNSMVTWCINAYIFIYKLAVGLYFMILRLIFYLHERTALFWG